jgi:diguanylate cyclase (GGDEF)-like protein
MRFRYKADKIQPMRHILNLLDPLSKKTVSLIAYLFIALLGILDYVTGEEISLSFFYLFPISLTIWKNGRKSGISTSLVSTFVWFGSNWLAGDEYSSIIIFYWNAVVRAGFFLTTTFLLSEIRVLLEQERNLSRTDSLTGVLNRRAFFEFAELQLSSLKRTFHPFSVVHFDIDNFKRVNDQFGHQAGDQLLQSVGDTISTFIRSKDRLVRLGGDEFLLYLPSTGESETRSIVPRLLEHLNGAMEKDQWSVSFSLGVIIFFKIPKTTEEMIRVADELMYESKKGGKNQVNYGIYE